MNEQLTTPCPVCGKVGYTSTSQLDPTYTFAHCPGCGLMMRCDSWNRLGRAAALLRAVEGLEAAPDGDAFASVMERGARCSLVADLTAPDGKWRVSRQCASGDMEGISEHPDFADALIALAAQGGEVEDA